MADKLLNLLLRLLSKTGSKWKTRTGLVLVVVGYVLPLIMKTDPSWIAWGDTLMGTGASLAGIGVFDKALKFEPKK